MGIIRDNLERFKKVREEEIEKLETEVDEINKQLNPREKKKVRNESIIERCKQRLKNIARKKFTTCFIFAISEFEKVFGKELWGHGLPEDELTTSQKANRKRWEQVRRDILDKGNTQLRAFELEMDLHNVEFIGYSMNFKVKGDE